MIRKEAIEILESMTKSESLLRHARSVELVMQAYAEKYDEDQNKWALCGLLHDADYEMYPDKHPNVIVELLREKGEEDIAYAISAHYSKWNKPPKSLIDKALLASDELTGFIIACCQIRPQGISDLSPGSVKKKLKNPKFAAKVDREEIQKGIAYLGIEESDHIAFIIDVLTKNRSELGI